MSYTMSEKKHEAVSKITNWRKRERIFSLYEDGVSVREIAAVLGCTHQWVYWVLKHRNPKDTDQSTSL